MFTKKRTRRQIKKTIVLFLLISLINQVVAPTVAFALTSGPTAPEATSFEPIDTTDMVNPLTGDFTYNLPLLEVPGPEGGYPLSLSYHAGIQPNEEASWVGLGWTLNPGALTRNVNGFPDDWYSGNSSRRDYWNGGSRTNYDLGVSIGLSGAAGNVSFGLSFSQDTYEGFGVGMNMGAGIGIGSNLGIGGNIGISPFGGSYASANIGSNGPISLGVGVGTNFESISANASGGIGYAIPSSSNKSRSGSLLGASISSDATSPSFSIGGISASTSNDKAGNISTSSSGFSIGIPIASGVFINLGFSKIRYWSDETASTTVHGSLHGSGWSVIDNRAYDNYALLDPEKNISTNPDPNKLQGGAYPDYDLYSVSGQGLSGNIRPYNFQGEMLSQNRKSGDTRVIEYFSPKTTDYGPEFRFVNDFSNSYRQTYPNYSNVNLNLKLVEPTFDNIPQYGNNDGDFGYGGINKLAGSKSIEYFTTSTDGTVGSSHFMKPSVAGLNRILHSGTVGQHIAGFAITNSSGVTYHYNLPAYSYGEEMYQEKIGGTFSYNRQSRNEGYAYTWYLTSVTGPDYVDRNGDQKVNNGDWGYWMNFEYGKWSDDYVWRNPSQGFHRDEDNQFRDVSMGKKEVYYLNAIRSRTHVAIFEKDVRFDGKGASSQIFAKNATNGAYTNSDGSFDNTSAQSMRLDKIYLLNAADAGIVTEATAGSGFEANVLDKNDVNAAGRSTLESKALRIIDFNYSYDLCKETPNSFYKELPYFRYGKLTLESLTFRGSGGANLIPPVEFEYGLSGSEVKNASGILTTTTFTAGSDIFEPGDLIETNSTTPVFCGVIYSKQQSGSSYIYTLRNSQYYAPTSVSVQLRTTKNPSYNKDAYDMWGMFKSDYIPSNNENLSRLTTPLSNLSTDVWSLRKIKTSLGSEIKVDYEGDTYGKSVLNQNLSMIINGFTKIDQTTWVFTINTGGQDLTKLYKLGDNLDFILLRKDVRPGPFGPGITEYAVVNTESGIAGAKPYIQSISTNQLQVKVSSGMGGLMNEYNESANLNGKLLTGNLRVSGGSKYYGGGIRVKSLETDDILSKYRANYLYDVPNSTISSGVTSYEPIGLEIDDAAQFGQQAMNIYRPNLYKSMDALYRITREVPPPGVMYEYVTVENEVEHSDQAQPVKAQGKTVYQYEVFRNNMIGRIEASPAQTGTSLGKTQYVKNLVLKKFIGALGALKKTTQYDIFNKKLNETVNNFLHDGLENLSLTDFMTQYEQRLSQFGYQGLLKERFSEVKEVREDNGSYTVRATFSAREEFPAVPLGQTSKDYVTGITTGTENIAFDFYSGSLTKMATKDAYGNRFLTVTEPAYRQYASMGLKINDSNNRNMLTQESSRTVYKVNSTNQYLGIAAASVQTWANTIRVDDENGDQTTVGQSVIWRPQSNYQWMMSGTSANNLTPAASFTTFDYSGSNGTSWKKTGEITRYNVYSAGLETSDINTQYAATRMGYKDSKVVISAAPAKYKEIAYTGAEDPLLANGKLSTGISLGAGTISSSIAHTGSKSINLAPGTNGITYQVPLSELDPARRDYQLAVWVKSSGDVSNARLFYQIDNQSLVLNAPSFQKVAAGWYLLEMRIPATALASGTNLTVGCRNNGGSSTLSFDDFRFQPFNSPTTSYVYNTSTGELTNILDNNNLYVKYEYDKIGRLIKVYKEVLGKASVPAIKEIAYNYSKPIALINNQIPFYARIEMSNHTNTYSFINNEEFIDDFADFHIRFYSDPACTIPYTLVAPITFDVRDENSWTSNFDSGNHISSAICTAEAGNSSLFLGNIEYSSQHNYFDSNYGWVYESNTYTYFLAPYSTSPYYPLSTKSI